MNWDRLRNKINKVKPVYTKGKERSERKLDFAIAGMSILLILLVIEKCS